MPFFHATLRAALLLAAGVVLTASTPGVAAEPVVLFGANGVSREWTPHSWGGLDITTKRNANAVPSYSVRLKENTEPYAGLTFKSGRGHALTLDPAWREKGLVVVRLGLGTDFYGTPLKALELKLALSLLLTDGTIKTSSSKFVPIHASVDGSAAPVVIVVPLTEFLDSSALPAPPVAATGLTLQHHEAPSGNFEIIECAFVLESN